MTTSNDRAYTRHNTSEIVVGTVLRRGNRPIMNAVSRPSTIRSWVGIDSSTDGTRPWRLVTLHPYFRRNNAVKKARMCTGTDAIAMQ